MKTLGVEFIPAKSGKGVGARFREEHVEIMPPIQYWFTGTALANFIGVLAAISTVGYGWYRAAIAEMESANNKIVSAELAGRRMGGLVRAGVRGACRVPGALVSSLALHGVAQHLRNALGFATRDEGDADPCAHQ